MTILIEDESFHRVVKGVNDYSNSGYTIWDNLSSSDLNSRRVNDHDGIGIIEKQMAELLSQLPKTVLKGELSSRF